jgi:hypothetical protein
VWTEKEGVPGLITGMAQTPDVAGSSAVLRNASMPMFSRP